MAEHLTEEEQLEALKRWWKENGTGLITAILVGVAAYSGWQFWNTQRAADDLAGSAKYDELVEAMSVENRTAEQTQAAAYLAEQLKSEHSDTFYGMSGAMFLARMAVEKNDLATAKTELEAAIAQGPSDALSPVLNLRLAKVQLSLKEYTQALSTLDKNQNQTALAAYSEVRGDVFRAQGDGAKATTAYRLALDSLSSQEFNRRSQLEAKINNVGLVAATSQIVDAKAAVTEATMVTESK